MKTLTLNNSDTPLLEVGFHSMSISDVRALCVDKFPSSTTREKVMSGLEVVYKQLSDTDIENDIWVDGSFLTEKLNPGDSDILIYILSEVYELTNKEQKKVLEVLDWARSDLKEPLLCHSFVHIAYPSDHDLGGYSEWMKAYWIRQYGFSQNDEIKGIALMQFRRQ